MRPPMIQIGGIC